MKICGVKLFLQYALIVGSMLSGMPFLMSGAGGYVQSQKIMNQVLDLLFCCGITFGGKRGLQEIETFA